MDLEIKSKESLYEDLVDESDSADSDWNRIL